MDEDNFSFLLYQFELIVKNMTQTEPDRIAERDLKRIFEKKSLLDKYNSFMESHTQTFRLESNIDTTFKRIDDCEKLVAKKRPSLDSQMNFNSAISQQQQQKHLVNSDKRCYLWYYNIFKLNGHLPHYLYCPMKVYVWIILNFCSIMVYLHDSMILTNFLKFTSRYVTYVEPSAWKSAENCVRKEDIHYRDSKRYQQHEMINFNDTNHNIIDVETHIIGLEKAYDYITSNLGSVVLAHGGLYAYYCQMLLIISIICNVNGMFSWNNESLLYLDSFSFRKNPIAERKRVIKNLQLIVLNMIQTCVISMQTIKEDLFVRSKLQKMEMSNQLENLPNIKPRISHSKRRDNSECCRSRYLNGSLCYCSILYFEYDYFLNMISDKDLIQSIRPINLNAKFYEKQSILRKYHYICHVLINIYFAIYLINSVIVAEINARVTNRKLILGCKLNYPNGTILQDIHQMSRDEITQELLETYYPIEDDKLDDWFGTQLRQFLYESRCIGAMSSIQGTFFILIGGFSNTIWNYFLTLFFTDGYFYHTQWLAQLEKQFDDCTRLLDYLYQLTKFSEQLKQEKSRILDYRFTKIHDYAKFNEHRKQVHKVLIITILNFELFKPATKDFGILCNYFFIYFLTLVFSNSILCFYWNSTELRSYVNQDITVVWTLTLVFTISLTYYVCCCVLLLRKLINLFRKMYYILAKMTLNSMQLDLIHEIWRRQLMKEADIAHIYSVHAFGIDASLSTLIGVNTAAFALSIFFASSTKYID